MSNDDLIELYEERAAVLEYEGSHSRSRAEYLALREVRKIIAPAALPGWLIERGRGR